MSEKLQEFCNSRGVQIRVDRESGVIQGVKILGLKSRNGRSYLPDTLMQAASLYENAKVNVNHPLSHPSAPRDYRDRLGHIRAVAFRPGEGLFGDLHFNPKHALAEQLLWDAEHAPENVGFSHNVEARTGRRGEEIVVEAITRVQSVDLVADPATTRGLFESQDENSDPNTPKITLESLQTQYPDLFEQWVKENHAEIERLEAEIEKLSSAQSKQEKSDAIRRILREHHLPDLDSDDPRAQKILSKPFIESLFATETETQLQQLISDRATLVEALRGDPAVQKKPLCRDQQLFGTPPSLDAKSFAEAIT